MVLPCCQAFGQILIDCKEAWNECDEEYRGAERLLREFSFMT